MIYVLWFDSCLVWIYVFVYMCIICVYMHMCAYMWASAFSIIQCLQITLNMNWRYINKYSLINTGVSTVSLREKLPLLSHFLAPLGRVVPNQPCNVELKVLQSYEWSQKPSVLLRQQYQRKIKTHIPPCPDKHGEVARNVKKAETNKKEAWNMESGGMTLPGINHTQYTPCWKRTKKL